ncbi:ATP-grasp domain-containing protein [Paraburkholderia sp. MMS20-SJTN17]|uniref:ATP-grasp domain-containing protein n=1 Tax=Paraburkholderia translucens TaxID=2886945 RepID=A0ABS8KEH0_9BURK|nr:ATP-grasp domain-containing protein [Paraburkholderia sp. MMS20-SJTN17]MCC8403155.1 ATP-grasp domain-containing protein [Paraburkholderia sp. MMS20-SJTN17]
MTKPHRPPTQAPFIAVAGLSARWLAQSAKRAGLHVAALDIFGDRDTREAAELWFDIGAEGSALAIDRGRLVDALTRLARLPDLLGWVGASGLEPLMPRLSRERGLPRYLGNDAEAMAAVREPRRFFALLDALRIAHPAVAFERPKTADGWLFKRADGCGGTHIQPATAFGAGTGSTCGYFQRVGEGRSLSALFIGAQGRAHVLGFAAQLTCAIGDRGFVHAGSIGPIELPPALGARIQEALDALCARTGLVGINSCDFLSDGTTFDVLEINARPSSTMALYETASPDAWPAGLLACHLDACRHGRPPSAASLALSREPRWRAGQRVLFAQRPFTVSPAFSDACLHDPQCRDVPMPGTRIEAGQPVCTLHVRAASVDAVRAALDAQHERVVQRIETCDESDHACLHDHS